MGLDDAATTGRRPDRADAVASTDEGTDRMYADYVSAAAIAEEVRQDLRDAEISGSDHALDRLEALLDAVRREERAASKGPYHSTD